MAPTPSHIPTPTAHEGLVASWIQRASTNKYGYQSAGTALLLLVLGLGDLHHLLLGGEAVDHLALARHLLPPHDFWLGGELPVIMALKASSMLCPSRALVSRKTMAFLRAYSSPCSSAWGEAYT